MKRVRMVCAIVLGCLTSACSGSGRHAAVFDPIPAATTVSSVPASNTIGHITLHIARPENSTRPQREHRQYVSTAAGELLFTATPVDPLGQKQYPNGVTTCVSIYNTGPPSVDVTVDAPIGSDYFTIAEYGGQNGLCEPGGTSGATVLSQFTYSATQPTPLSKFPGDPAGLPAQNAPVIVAAGVNNNLNAIVWTAYTQAPPGAPPPTLPAANAPSGAPGTAPSFAGVLAGAAQQPVSAAAAAYLATEFDIPTVDGSTDDYPTLMLTGVLGGLQVVADIQNPTMELAPFQAAGDTVVVPLSVFPFDAAGGQLLTQGQNYVAITEPVMMHLTLSETDASNVVPGNRPPPHTRLFLIDTTVNHVVQSGTTLSFDNPLVLDAGMIAAGTCGANCAPGDLVQFYMTYDGSTQAAFTDAVITPSYLPPAGSPKPIFANSAPIIPQQILATTNNFDPVNFPDPTIYHAPLGVASGGGALFVADQGQIRSDNTANASPPTSAIFTGLAYDAGDKYVYAVDNSSRGGPFVYGYSATNLGAGGAVSLGGTNTSFAFPSGVVYDPKTNALYGTSTNELWQVSLDGPTSGTANVVAGSPTAGRADGIGAQAGFYFANASFIGLAVDTNTSSPTYGDVYVADQGNGLIRLFNPANDSVTTVANLVGVRGLTLATIGGSNYIIATTSALGIAAIPTGIATMTTPTTVLAATGGAAPMDGFVGPPPPLGIVTKPIYYTLQTTTALSGPPFSLTSNPAYPAVDAPTAPAATAMGLNAPDTMAYAQSNSAFSTAFGPAGSVVSPFGIVYIPSPAGSFPGGTLVFTENGTLRGLL